MTDTQRRELSERVMAHLDHLDYLKPVLPLEIRAIIHAAFCVALEQGKIALVKPLSYRSDSNA